VIGIAAAVLLAGLVSASAYLWWQTTIRPPADEVLFDVCEPQPERVGRDPHGWVVTSTSNIQPVALRVHTGPDDQGAPVVLTRRGREWFGPFSAPPPARPFFTIEFNSGPPLVTRERILPLSGAANFRDLGGYPTLDGRTTVWGAIYRSDDLSRLTDTDLDFLHSLGLRLICDLRTSPEAAVRPDRLPDGTPALKLPVFERDPGARLQVLFARHRMDATLKRLYRVSILTEGAPALGRLLRLAADPANLPLLLHCTSGKDRTGVACALLLHICGVARPLILADYSLTNLAAGRLIAMVQEAFTAVRMPPGFHIQQIYPLLSARPEILAYAFQHIETTYGSVDQYLHGPLGLTQPDLDAIRTNLTSGQK
jgi:protein-tyrosine phosphatase